MTIYLSPEARRELVRTYLAEYNQKHIACPVCGSTHIRSHMVGFALDVEHPEAYRDENQATCECGWSGRVHDLVYS